MDFSALVSLLLLVLLALTAVLAEDGSSATARHLRRPKKPKHSKPPTHSPQAAPTAQPTPRPSAALTAAPITSHPTKVPASKSPTKRPSLPPSVSANAQPSPRPSVSSECTQRAPADCSGDCQITSGRAGSSVYYYGCQSVNFCNYRMGGLNDQRLQCQAHASCVWSAAAATRCAPSGANSQSNPPSPTSDPWLCYDGCFTSNDGVCDDGGPGSVYGFCPYGSDCSDCGSRDGVNFSGRRR